MKWFHALILVLLQATALAAQSPELTVGTVSRPPFSHVEDGAEAGFSMDLWRELAKRMERGFTVQRYDSFGDMLSAAESGAVDLAIANISITATREAAMDFSQPIFESGLQVMVPATGQIGSPILSAILSIDFLVAVLLAFATLFGGGMLMWHFERRAQPYFDKTAREALFPSFWWALNLVVNGGFEERVPRTAFGRVFGVLLVISSLFIVSVFVAHITSAMTVSAISHSVNSVNDLYGKQVGTLEKSTAARFLDRRDIRHVGYETLDALIQDFEAGTLQAVVFDAPVLAYYVNGAGAAQGVLAGPVFMRENYGIATPPGSPLIEEINQHLLTLREDGSYEKIYQKWFGALR